MKAGFSKNQIAIAVAAAIGAAAIAAVPTTATAAKVAGKYVTGDFHNHTTCSDGTISMEKLIKKSTDKVDTPWGLDWFIQSGHGGNNSARNCTLAEDDTLSTPVYPFVTGTSPMTTWTASIGAANLKGDGGGVGGNGNMWRWQSIQEYQYPLVEYYNALKGLPLFIGLESTVAGHEHSSMDVITGQVPASIDAGPNSSTSVLPTGHYAAVGNADALAQWNYCFDVSSTDTSRGNVTGTSTGNNWDCAVPGSNSTTDISWNTTAHKLIPTGSGVGSGLGTKGHLKTVEGIKWMAAFHPGASYYVPAHLERAGPFTPDGNFGYNVESLRDFNNASPNIAFGFESQPGHGASPTRGEYTVLRNSFPEGGTKVDSVGGTTYGGTGVYAGQVGGVWDALLGEGRRWWFFASSDWHARGQFGADDRRTDADFYPGEYQRTYVMVRNGADKIRPQAVVDGLRSGNVWSTQGQLIDRLSFVACVSYPGLGAKTNAQVEALAVAAATGDTDIDNSACATMGEKLKVRQGADIVVTAVVRDPTGTNYSPYSFDNPSLVQDRLHIPINAPVLDHVDLIQGMVTGFKTPGAPDYSGAWPRNTAWLHTDGTTAGLGAVPDAAKNLSAQIIKTFAGGASPTWTPVVAGDGTTYYKMTFRITGVGASQYVRLRGTNLPPATPWETDAAGNPLSDIYTNSADQTMLRIPCTTVATNLPAVGATFSSGTINGCPGHLKPALAPSPIAGQTASSTDVAAWSDLWFYSNPIYVEVAGSTLVAGIQ